MSILMVIFANGCLEFCYRRYRCFPGQADSLSLRRGFGLDDDGRHVVNLRPEAAEIASAGAKDVDNVVGRLGSVGADNLQGSIDPKQLFIAPVGFHDTICHEPDRIAW